MEILIVEDDPLKFESIYESISKILTNVRITRTEAIYDAKKSLLSKYYDLLILDISLPLELGGECQDSSGIDLFNEISSIDIYKKPQSILFLTSYENLHEKYKNEIESKLFSILKYSNLTSEWKTSLLDHISHLIRAKSDSGSITSNDSFDLGIITAVDIEYQAVRNMLEEIKEVRVSGDPTIYYTGIYNRKSDLKIIFCKQHQMGIAAATTLTIKLMMNFKPKIVSMVGIAAGKKGEGQLGDILVPTEVWDYGSGKYISSDDSKSESLFLPDPKYISLDIEMKEMVNKDYSIIAQEIYDEYNLKKPNNNLSIVKGPLASGSAVVQDEEIVLKYIDPFNRKMKGLDMESYGVFYAVENFPNPKPKLIICKSICDFADKEKSDDYQHYASYTSSSFLFKFLDNNDLLS